MRKLLICTFLRLIARAWNSKTLPDPSFPAFRCGDGGGGGSPREMSDSSFGDDYTRATMRLKQKIVEIMGARLRFSIVRASSSRILPLSLSASPPLCGGTWFRVITRRRGGRAYCSAAKGGSSKPLGRAGWEYIQEGVESMMRTAIHPPESNLGERVARAIRDYCAFRLESRQLFEVNSRLLVGDCKANGNLLSLLTLSS